MISNIPASSFGGIYSLVDDNGKRYIGSSKNIRQRVKSHKSHINTYLRDGVDGFVNPAIKKAVKQGLRFRCEVLAVFNCDMTETERREIERIYIAKFGGYEALYNYCVISHKIS